MIENLTSVTVGCRICQGSREIEMKDLIAGQIICQKCNQLISVVDTSPMDSWIEKEVERKRKLQASGKLRTRIQSTKHSDQEIDRDGLHAEFAACLVLCPRRLVDWQHAAQSNKKNRGRDLPKDLTGLSKHVEIKSTPCYNDNVGHLLIRPPSSQGRVMKPAFVDDSYYFLLSKDQSLVHILGWVDRIEFLKRKRINPVGKKRFQVECWGVFWKKLLELSKLERSQQTNVLKFDK